MMTLSIPWVFDMAMLSDREMKKEDYHGGKGGHQGKAVDKSGFIFIRTPFNKHGRNYDEMFDGKHTDNVFQNGDVHFHKRDEIGRGAIPGPDGSTLHYMATRGDMRVGRDTVDGVTTLIAVECPNDQKFRMGIWFGPDPTAASNQAEPDRPKMPEPLGIVPGKPAPPAFAGSPADEAAIKDFMSHFTICK
jgi:hypothetical protein